MRFTGPEPRPWPKRPPVRGTRWLIRKSRATGQWYAGPISVGVFANLAHDARWMTFTTHTEALAYVLERINQQ